MNENDQYVEEIKERLTKIDDEELKSLVLKLIEERNNLSTTIKIDPLTGLYNRRILTHIRIFSAAVMIDIDDFKKINDTFGHDVGDKVIQQIAQILKNNTRISDYVCRTGGEEFLVVFTDCTLDIVKTRIEKILKQITDEIKLKDLSVTVSAGIAFKNGNEDFSTLMIHADEALYESKKNGKNCITCYNEI